VHSHRYTPSLMLAAALALWEPPEVAESLLALYDRLAVRMDEARGPRDLR